MAVLMLVRHGQSLWNMENRFTGWEDIDLSPKGEGEAKRAGQTIAKQNIVFHSIWTSLLTRAKRTLDFILQECPQNAPVYSSWRLNERHYGKLQGCNKADMKKQYGPDQIFEWRRSFHQSPPKISIDSPKHPCRNALYKHIPKNLLPVGESLEETMNRVMPLWYEKMLPLLEEGKNILITAHGNSLRSLVKHIRKISDKDIPHFEIPTASPLKIEWKKSQSIQELPNTFEFLT